jgi:hypothetical protein
MLLTRAFIYTCAFIGAGWFGDWVYQAASSPGGTWDTSFYIVIGAGIVAGLSAAVAITRATRT